MKFYTIIIICIASTSCNGQYYSAQKEYKSHFTKEKCIDSTVYFTPHFQTFGFDYNELDTVKIIFFTKNGRFDNPLDSTILFLNDSDIIVENKHIGTRHFHKAFFLPGKPVRASVDFTIKFGNYFYKVSGIQVRERYIDSDKNVKLCGIYSYSMNGKKLHYHNFLLTKTKKLNQRPYYFFRKTSLFVNKISIPDPYEDHFK